MTTTARTPIAGQTRKFIDRLLGEPAPFGDR
jgi:hypothetical protein